MLSGFYTNLLLFSMNTLLFLANSPLPLSWEERGEAVEDGAFSSFILFFICFAFQFLTALISLTSRPFQGRVGEGLFMVGRVCLSLKTVELFYHNQLNIPIISCLFSFRCCGLHTADIDSGFGRLPVQLMVAIAERGILKAGNQLSV